MKKTSTGFVPSLDSKKCFSTKSVRQKSDTKKIIFLQINLIQKAEERVNSRKNENKLFRTISLAYGPSVKSVLNLQPVPVFVRFETPKAIHGFKRFSIIMKTLLYEVSFVDTVGIQIAN